MGPFLIPAALAAALIQAWLAWRVAGTARGKAARKAALGLAGRAVLMAALPLAPAPEIPLPAAPVLFLAWLTHALFMEFRPLPRRALVPWGQFGTIPVLMAQGAGPQLNARAEGVFLRRRVVINDSLLQALPPDQARAVMAHEAGHLALYHRERYLLWRAATVLVILAATAPANVLDATQLALAAPNLALLLAPLRNRLIRAWEFQADAWAARATSPAILHTALAAIFAANAAPPGDRWWRAFHHPHPEPEDRLQRLVELRSGQAIAE